ncbi:YoaK family protein [Dietzia sp. NPDC055340]
MVGFETGRVGQSEALLGAWLLAIAGFVDAVAFVVLQGSFVAFMSGNTTILGSSSANGHWHPASLSAVLIALFFAGNVGGAALVRYAGRAAHRLLMVSIAAVILVGTIVANTVSPMAGLVVTAIAAGLINSALAAKTDVHVGLTYVTGTLVKAAHQLVEGVGSDRPWAWSKTLGFWAVFAGGAVVGGAAFSKLGTAALWCAVGLALVACVLPHRTDSPTTVGR